MLRIHIDVGEQVDLENNELIYDLQGSLTDHHFCLIAITTKIWQTWQTPPFSIT